MVERIVKSAVFPFGIAQHRAKVEKSLLLFSKLVERTWDTLFNYLSHLLIHYRCYESWKHRQYNVNNLCDDWPANIEFHSLWVYRKFSLGNLYLRHYSCLVDSLRIHPNHWSIPKFKLKIKVYLANFYVKRGFNRYKPHIIPEILRANEEVKVFQPKGVRICCFVCQQLDIVVADLYEYFVWENMAVLAQIDVRNLHTVEFLYNRIHVSVLELIDKR